MVFKPHRAFEAGIHASADTFEQLVLSLQRIVGEVRKRTGLDVISAAPDASHICKVRLVEDAAKTHDEYFRELDTWLDEPNLSLESAAKAAYVELLYLIEQAKCRRGGSVVAATVALETELLSAGVIDHRAEWLDNLPS